ncbi:type III-B CRISPR-associated protein Cas10/Cmr2 [bacterium]|nr:type III-B CRISPR-associated protein Cas10/Cmr2 [bacterium]
MCYSEKIKCAIEECQKLGGGISVLSADTDKVKSYVYSSTKLPEMRGASIILDTLNRDEVEKITAQAFTLKTGILYNKGGSVLAIVPTPLCCEVKSKIEKLYPSKTDGQATITAVHEEVNEEDIWNNFDTIIKRLSNRLKQAKEQRTLFPLREVIPYARLCQSCGLRPVNKREPAVEGIIYLCLSCYNKRRAGQYNPDDEESGKTLFFNKFLDELNAPGYKISAERILKQYQKLNPTITLVDEMIEDADNARDLEDISDENGYIGVIYADGNEIGSIIEKLKDAETFMRFSDNLYEITEESVFSALADFLYPKSVEHRIIFPFEIISIGGDDVFMIVPAKIALQVASRLCKNFEDKAQNSDVPELKTATLSAGVVIAKENFPVYYVYDLVTQLLKSAKNKAKFDLCNIKTAIDFMALKSQGGEVSDIENYRKSVLKRTESFRNLDQKLELTFRPYLLKDFEALLDFAVNLNKEGFPKSKLYAIRESLETSRANSTLLYLYLMARSKDNEKQILKEYFPESFLDDTDKLIPWKKTDERIDGVHKYIEYQTPIVDILEIFDFVDTEVEF